MHFVLFTGSVLNMLSEDLFKIVFDNKAYSAESRLISIIKAEIHYDVALICYLIELFVAAISAAHTGSHDY